MDHVADTETYVTVPEAARRLGIPGADVYRLIFRGELDGGPWKDGAVYVPAAAVEEFQRRAATERQDTK